MDPITIYLLAQAGLGAYQFFKGKSDASNLKRPTYDIPEEIKSKLSAAQSRLIEGLPEASKKLYIDNLQRSMASGLRNLSTRQAGIQGLAGITDVRAQQSRQLAAQDAAQRLQSQAANRAAIESAQSEMAGYRDKAYQLNQLQPYQQQAQASQALMGAGIQNLAGALQGGIGAAGQKKYIDALTKEGSANRKALIDLLNTGKTTGAAASNLGALIGPPTEAQVVGMGTGEYAKMGPNLLGVEAPAGTQGQEVASVVPQEFTTFLNTINEGSNVEESWNDVGSPIKSNNNWSKGLFDNIGKEGVSSNAITIPGLSEAMAEKPIVRKDIIPEITVTPGDMSKGGFADLAQPAETPSVAGGFGGGVGGGGASASLEAPKEAIELKDSLPGWIKSLMLNLNYPEKRIHSKYNELKDSGNKEEAENFINEQFPQVYQNINDFIKDYQGIVNEGWGEAINRSKAIPNK